jgi:hypothetical protein
MANVDPKPSPLLRAALHFHEPPDHRKTYAKPTLRAVEGPVALYEQVNTRGRRSALIPTPLSVTSTTASRASSP